MKKLSFLCMFLLAGVMAFAATYTKVVTAPTDWNGNYLIVYEANETEAKVFSGVDAVNGFADANNSDGKIFADNLVEIEIAAVGGGYSLKVLGGGNVNKFIGQNTNANGLKFYETADVCTLDIIDGNAVIKSVAGNVTMKWNNNSDQQRFRFYKSGQMGIQLYKKEDGGSTTDPVAVTGVILNVTETALTVGETATLKASVQPANADNQTITWATSDAAVATVESGVVTAVGAGSATVTVTTEDGNFTATCTVTVSEPLPAVEYALLPLEDILDVDDVVITWTKSDGVYALTSANGSSKAPDAVAVTVTDGKVVTNNTDLVWNVTKSEEGYVIMPVGQTEAWLYVTASNNGVRVGTNDNKYFNIDAESGYLVGNDGTNTRYLGVYNQQDVRCYTTVNSHIKEQTLAFYVKQNAPRPRKLAGAYNIGGANADYVSLAAACADIDTAMIAGDIQLLICADLEEPKNMGIKNASDYTITITVDQAAERKITFMQTTDNAGPSGNICIGCDMTLTHASAASLTQNVIIDGSYEGDGERWLTLETASGVNKFNGPILIYGNVKNSVVRNTKMIVLNGSGSSNYGVTIRTQTGSALAPEHITIENNYIQNLGGVASQGLYFQRAGTSTANPSDVTIVNNDFVVTTRGIFMGANSGTTVIKGNTFRLRQTATGMLSYGIWGYQNVEGTIEVAENRFQELSTAADGASAGVIAIQVGVGGDWTVTNNYITGFNPTSATADIQLKGIVSAKVGSAAIAHNTIVLNTLVNAPSAAGANSIVMLNANGATSVKNNLVVSYETAARNALVANASEVLANNVYYTDETSENAYYTAEQKTLVDYQTIESTAKSVMVNFTDVAAGDLSLTGSSVGDSNLGVARLDDVLTDIVGTSRAATTYAGAFEASDLTATETAVEKLTLNGVWYADGIVYNTENIMLYVYNVNGMLVASGMNNINMNGQVDGMYIVRSAEGALKFVK